MEVTKQAGLIQIIDPWQLTQITVTITLLEVRDRVGLKVPNI